MKIRELGNYNLDQANIFAYEKIRNIENLTPLFPNKYEDIRKCFIKLSNHDVDQVLVCYKGEKIIGLISIVVEVKRKQITVIGGPLIDGNIYKIANTYSKYFKQMYSGFSFVFVVHEYNTNQIKFAEILKGHLFNLSTVFTYHNCQRSIENNIFLVDENNFNEFDELHKNSKLIYQASKLINSNLFKIYLYTKGSNKGCVIIKDAADHKEIVEVLTNNTSESFLNKLLMGTIHKDGYIGKYIFEINKNDSLYNSDVIKKNFDKGKDKLYYRVDI